MLYSYAVFFIAAITRRNQHNWVPNEKPASMSRGRNVASTAVGRGTSTKISLPQNEVTSFLVQLH
jgi:hypothetical protein